MLFTPQIIAIYILDGIFLALGLVAFFVSIQIFLKWDMSKTTPLQYKLEKRGFLVSTIIKYLFLVKLPLFLFFIFILDDISNVIVGAMCAAGVVDATPYGTNLLVLKFINLYLFGFWLILHSFDISSEKLPFTKVKFGFFIFIFLLFILELTLEVLTFSAIDPSIMVSCCGTLFSANSATYISAFINIDTPILLGVFYMNFIILLSLYFYKNSFLYSIFSLLFIISSVISLIAFFGTYIYELPTHHCPFCFLQKDYYYIGYVLYATLFLGTFFGLVTQFFKKDSYYKYSIFFIVVYTIIVTLYPLSYYIRNGVWL